MTIHTGNVALILGNDSRIILNCTYNKDATEDVYTRNIRWQKQIGDEFIDIGMFSQPGGLQPIIEKEMQPLYSNRTELIAPNTSLSAVMIIKDPVCSDEGIYRCWIKYFSDSSEKVQTNYSIVAYKGIYVLLIYFEL